MANPRKFSEKIALHNQKQAEETAAFEQIMREVSDATSKPAVPEDTKNMHDQMHSYQEIRGRKTVGPMRSPRPEKSRIDTSPYSSGSYLSPPPDTSWRRTHSDSALHHSASSDQSGGSPCRRVDPQQLLNMEHLELSRKHLMVNSDGRPRSCCDVPRVPGIAIFPSQQEPGTVQIPIGNNTGSLPDLTNFHFPSPLPTPLDLEDNSSYSTSPQATSPSTLSPTSRPLGRFSFGSQGSPQGPSPGHSPGSQRRHHQQQMQRQQQQQHSSSHLFVPSSHYMNSRYFNSMSKGISMDNSLLDGFDQKHQQLSYQQQQQQHQQQQQQQQHRSSPQPPSSPQQGNAQCSPPLVTNNMTSHSMTSYRNPMPILRPSPQNSPGLIIQGSPSNYRRCCSPAEHSAPQSPVSQNLSPASSPGISTSSNQFADSNSFYITQAQTLHQLEQFTMDWCQLVHSLVESSCGWTTELQLDNPVQFITSHNSNSVQYPQNVNQGSPEDGVTRVGSQEMGNDAGYYSQSPSQLQYSGSGRAAINPSGGSTQQTTPQTPNTPSSIPDIILTDFSSTADEKLRHELVTDLSSAMAGSFDSELFPSDETLREGLDPIEFDDLQMLTDPEMNVVSDPSTEDNFRLDRL